MIDEAVVRGTLLKGRIIIISSPIEAKLLYSTVDLIPCGAPLSYDYDHIAVTTSTLKPRLEQLAFFIVSPQLSLLPPYYISRDV
jgi:hypothetical protein